MIALLILLIGCMNFVNLSNARSVYRIKEVGLRKVIGAGRGQLIRQFLSESIIITFLAALCAALLTNLLLPFFNRFAVFQCHFGPKSKGYDRHGYSQITCGQ